MMQPPENIDNLLEEVRKIQHTSTIRPALRSERSLSESDAMYLRRLMMRLEEGVPGFALSRNVNGAVDWILVGVDRKEAVLLLMRITQHLMRGLKDIDNA
jgi:hypothetical protein